MMLLTPVIFVLVFGSTFLRLHSNPSEFLRPVMSAALMGMVLLGMVQFVGNQFGFDRSGFRAFVLAGAHRSDILLGKNLAMLPFALALGGIGTAALQFAFPMHLDHFIAAGVQMVSMYLVFCLVLNLLSMLAPTAVASGSLRPVSPKGVALLIHLLFFFLVLPIALITTLMPVALEFLLKDSGRAVACSGLPAADADRVCSDCIYISARARIAGETPAVARAADSGNCCREGGVRQGRNTRSTKGTRRFSPFVPLVLFVFRSLVQDFWVRL